MAPPHPTPHWPPPPFPRYVHPIWLASYPRSGNTFLRIILQSVFDLPSYSAYNLDASIAAPPLAPGPAPTTATAATASTPAPHVDPSAAALAEPPPLLPADWRQRIAPAGPHARAIPIKTHGPDEPSGAAIYLVRDGRAAIDSYFHYHRRFAFEQPSLTEIIAGACQFGSWSAHYRSWRPRTRPHTLLLRYEELIARPEAAIAQLAEFLNVPPATPAPALPHASPLPRPRGPGRGDAGGQGDGGDGRGRAGGGVPSFEELRRRAPDFFRRGDNRDYLAQWTGEQMALFNRLHGPVMEELGYPLAPSDRETSATEEELAHAAARLHRKYLEAEQARPAPPPPAPAARDAQNGRDRGR